MISLIAAMSRNRVIGIGNRLPWQLPEDLKYFRRVTSGHPVVMGRRTYESIGRLLPGRENRIVTRQKEFSVPGARVFHSVAEACGAAAFERAHSDEIFVIGGAEIYAQALPIADRLYLTLIDTEIEGDAFFPEWAAESFQEISRETHLDTPAQPLRFSFVVLERKVEHHAGATLSG